MKLFKYRKPKIVAKKVKTEFFIGSTRGINSLNGWKIDELVANNQDYLLGHEGSPCNSGRYI